MTVHVWTISCFLYAVCLSIQGFVSTKRIIYISLRYNRGFALGLVQEAEADTHPPFSLWNFFFFQFVTRLYYANIALNQQFKHSFKSTAAPLYNFAGQYKAWICFIKMTTQGSRVKRFLVLNESQLTSSVSFTRRICSRRSCRSLNVDCAVME